MKPVGTETVGTETTDRSDAIDGQPNRTLADRERPFDVPPVLERAAAWGWRLLVVGAAILFIGWALVQVRVVVIPAFVAVLLAALLTPAVDLFDRWMPRILATWVTLLSVIVLGATLVWLLQAPIRDSVDDLVASWDTAVVDLEDWLQEEPLSLSEERVDELRERVEQASTRAASGLFESPGSAARHAAEVIGGIFLAAALTFFLLKDGRSIWAWTLDHVRPSRQSSVDVGGRAAFRAFQGWIRGVAITGLVDAVIIGGALIILGVPAALPLTVITFFAAFFPIIGATLAGALATLIALATEGTRTAVIVAIVVVVVQQIEGDVVLPVVMRRQVSLHPAVVLLALAVGGVLGGVIGALVAVPLTAAGAAATRAIRSARIASP
jgi:putative heme transporter